VALTLAGCKCAEPPPHSADGVPKALQTPETQRAEGHGGIAVVEPKPAAIDVPPPSAWDAGACGAQTPKDLYLQAYTIKDTDPTRARELWRQVVACTPDDDKFHQKAAAYLQLSKP
jgi:hypothetical protein